MRIAMTIPELRAVLEAARVAGAVLAGVAFTALLISIAHKAIPQAAQDAVLHEEREAW